MDEPHAELHAVVGMVAPRVRREQVFALEVEPLKRLGLLRSEKSRPSRFGELYAVAQVPIADDTGVAGQFHPLCRIFTNCFQHPVVRVVHLHHHQRFFHESRHEVEHVRPIEIIAGGDRFRGFECKVARKNRKPPEQHALWLRQQLVAPVDQRAQRLLPRERCAVAARQQPETVIQAGGNGLDSDRAHASSGEFDRQRNAIQSVADLRDVRGVVLGQVKRRLRGHRSLDEKPCGVRLGDFRKRGFALRIGNDERRQRIRRLAANVQPLAAGRQELHARQRLQQFRCQFRAGVDQMLAVVEDEQQLAVSAMPGQRLRHGAARFLLDPERRGHRLRHQFRVCERRKFDQPHAVGEIIKRVGRDLKRQARLAKAAGADDGDEPCSAQQFPDLVQLTLAADERRHLLRQVVRYCFERAQRGKVFAQRRMHHLIDPFRPREVAQAHGTKVAQRHAGRQPRFDQIGDGLRHQHLSAIGGAHDARGTVDGAAEEVVVAALDDAGVQSATDMQRDGVFALRLADRLLQRYRGADRIEGIAECCVESIAGRLDDEPSPGFDGTPRERIMAGEGGPHALGLLLPEARAAFDVGEQERRDGGLFLHDRSLRDTDPALLYGSGFDAASAV
ncbi:MAG TPA: hypothetical protein VKU81_06600 [Casimicrobiaceae bacterium]|nr:hypothetical protein [Casimicrobiaceae bacterium]